MTVGRPLRGQPIGRRARRFTDAFLLRAGLLLKAARGASGLPWVRMTFPLRYLVRFGPKQTTHVFTDLLVIGGGIAGLRAALAAPPDMPVLVVTKDQLQLSNSSYAQGGIAAVRSPEDRFENHIEDTLTAGAGLCDRDIVEMVVREAPGQIDDLIRCGAHFDAERHRPTAKAATATAASSTPSATPPASRSCGRSSTAPARRPNVTIWDRTFTIDLLTHDGRCVGALVRAAARGHLLDLGEADDPRQRRRRHGLPRNDQPARGDRRRHGRRLPRRRRAARHGVHAVPPDGALRRRFQPVSHQRGGARRGRLFARQERRPLHARRGPARRTGHARRGGAGHRPPHGNDAAPQRLPRPVAPGPGARAERTSPASTRCAASSAWTSRPT